MEKWCGYKPRNASYHQTQKRQGTTSALEPPEGAWTNRPLHLGLHFGLLVSRMVGKYISVVLSLLVYGNLIPFLQETNTTTKCIYPVPACQTFGLLLRTVLYGFPGAKVLDLLQHRDLGEELLGHSICKCSIPQGNAKLFAKGLPIYTSTNAVVLWIHVLFIAWCYQMF